VLRTILMLLAVATITVGCTGYDRHYDGDFIPYALRGFDVWISWGDDQELYVGRVEASYRTRRQGLLDCNSSAVAEANRMELDPADWGYVCCTVTASSDCVTKVR